jgi:hypothetical protein
MRWFSSVVFCLGLLSLLLPAALSGQDKTETGFMPLLNGKNLDGWRTKKTNEPLDGKTEAFKGRFRVEDGNLIIDPKVKGDVYIETVKEFGPDVTIKFEFNPGPGCNNDLFLLGTKFDIVAKNLKNVKEGEWNTLEIVASGGKIEHKVNGETKAKANAKGKTSTFSIRAEFGPLQIKNLRVKE